MTMPGEVFGELTILRETPSKGYHKCVEVRCSCGTVKVVRLDQIKRGTTVSCGHVRTASVRKRSTRHGMAIRENGIEPPEYVAWLNMKARCYYEGYVQFKDYGGRGIRVCDSWKDSFEAFYEDVGPRPGRGHSLDRQNNDGNYEPGNVRWATKAEQTANKRPKSKHRRKEAGEQSPALAA